MKVLIITRRRGIKLTAKEICVRVIDNQESALRAYPQIRTYWSWIYKEKNEIRYYSKASVKWYDNRIPMDSFKTIYLTD